MVAEPENLVNTEQISTEKPKKKSNKIKKNSTKKNNVISKEDMNGSTNGTNNNDVISEKDTNNSTINGTNSEPTTNATAQPTHIPKETLQFVKTSGGRITRYPTVFTKDSKYLFACVDNTIRVFSVSTGAVVKVLSDSSASGGHKADITKLVLNPKNSMQLYSASLDGTIKLWDYNDEILLKTYHVGRPVRDMVICPAEPDFAYVLLKSLKPSDEKKQGVYRYDLEMEKEEKARHLRRIIRSSTLSDFDVSVDGKYLAAVDKAKLYVWWVKDGDEDVPKHDLRSYKWNYTARKVRFSPTEAVVAVTDTRGRIVLHRCFTPETVDKPTQNVLHWHTTEPSALTFMGDGYYLISGGDEHVLVYWQLETGHSQFLPRLGGAISSVTISPNHKYFAVSLRDNSIRLINAISQRVEQVIQGLQYARVSNKTSPLSTGLVVEPRNHHLVLNGVPGSVQFYNVNSDRHVMDVEVTPSNKLHSGLFKPTETHVEHVAFDEKGAWMATVDMHDDNITTPEIVLKFWQWDPNTQAYILHTRVDHPHAAAITSLIFNPGQGKSGPMAITTSLDKTFRVWHLTTNLGARYDENEVAWTCRSVGMYRRDVPTSAAFSADGSILAVAFGSLITLWDPYQNSIHEVFAQPLNVPIRSLHFIGESPYLLCATAGHIYVWNMLTCSVWWAYRMEADYIAVDPTSPVFAVAVNVKKDLSRLILFEAKTAVPRAIYTLDERCKGLAIVGRDASSKSSRGSSKNDLVCLTGTYRFIHLKRVSGGEKKMAKEEKEKSKTSLPEEQDKKLFNDIYGSREQELAEEKELIRQRIQSATEPNTRKAKAKSALDNDGSILGAPSHALPSVDDVFETFMSSLMALRIQRDQTECMDVDDEQVPPATDSSATVYYAEQENEEFTLEELPSLDNCFASMLKSKENNHIPAEQPAEASSSDTDNSSDDEDPAKIDW